MYLDLYLSTIGMLRQDIKNYLKLPIKNPYVDYYKSLLNKLTNHLCYAIKDENRIETWVDLFAVGQGEQWMHFGIQKSFKNCIQNWFKAT